MNKYYFKLVFVFWSLTLLYFEPFYLFIYLFIYLFFIYIQRHIENKRPLE